MRIGVRGLAGVSMRVVVSSMLALDAACALRSEHVGIGVCARPFGCPVGDRGG